MFEEALLAKQFKSIHTQARQAEQLYTSLAGSITDPDLREQVAQLSREKQRHVRLTERLMEIVE